MINDWVAEAAREILSGIKFKPTESWIATVIIDNCPFKRGVTYEEIKVEQLSQRAAIGDTWNFHGLMLTWTGGGWITHAVQPDVEVERLRKARRTTDFTRCPFIMPITIDGKEKQCALWEGHAGNHEWKMHEGQCE